MNKQAILSKIDDHYNVFQIGDDMMIKKKLFERYDSEYLESLSDEEFFSRRFELSDDDKAELERNSRLVKGRRFYSSKVLERILGPYARETNPKPGEPGSMENPMVRFGRKYVYDERGDLIEDFREKVMFTLTQDMRPTDEQKLMIKNASEMPVVYDEDCPKSTPETIEGFKAFGRMRNERRRAMTTAT